ncbi:tripartite tricarboxylate transporter TctB family protein [Alphaproteobacteria bacterium KMM 3653]|uniref:Tripartite tricarboxylate transporter TctB family protein n=1 Tax=Harenicola maris TaxID=2841044 RepID=A0AAP2CR29_9RHOB|nr:tripartite tricarboxylate transporter TctB family protein [Harenicola maris]
MAVIAAAWGLTFKIDTTFSSDLETLTGPRAYPRLILSVMAVLAALLLFRSTKLPKLSEADGLGNMVVVGLAIGLCVVFVALFEPLGYIIAMPPLVFSTGLLFGKRKPLQVSLYAAVISGLVLFALRYGLNTVLPEGLLGVDGLF